MKCQCKKNSRGVSTTADSAFPEYALDVVECRERFHAVNVIGTASGFSA